MLRPALLALLTYCLFWTPAQAQSSDEQAFMDFHTGLAIDDKCHFLRAFERGRTWPVEQALLAPLDFYRANSASKITQEDYLASYNKLVEAGRVRAAEIACTDNQMAAPYIIGIRDRIARDLYSDLIIATQAGSLLPEQMQAAQTYERLIAPLYGENWQGFAQYAQGQAQVKVDKARADDVASDPFAGQLFADFGLSGALSADDPLYEAATMSYYFDSMVEGTVRMVDDLLFEWNADAAGYRVRLQSNPEDTASMTTLVDAAGTRMFDLWQSLDRYETLDGASAIPVAFTVRTDGSIRLMTMGDTARTAMANGSITLMVHPDALPDEEESDFTFMRSPEWWNAARVFEAERVDEPCLGAPCFALPGEVIDLIEAGSDRQQFRFFLSTEPDPAMPAPDQEYIHPGYPYALQSRKAVLASMS